MPGRRGSGCCRLPGHFFDMVGFRTPDDVVYLADCLSSRETLEKYQIGFLYDVAAYLNTLETVKTLRARAFVPAHAAVTEDIVPLAQYNIDKVLEIADIITGLCRTPQTFESVLQQLFRRFDLVMDFEQYALVGSTVRSYLAWGRTPAGCRSSLTITACSGSRHEVQIKKSPHPVGCGDFFSFQKPVLFFHTRKLAQERLVQHEQKHGRDCPHGLRLKTTRNAHVASQSCHDGAALYMSILAVSSSTP